MADGTLALTNDDDFQVVGAGTLQTKFLLDGVTVDFGEVYFVQSLTPLF
jgi:hypothetical protein